ncbi:MAG: peptide chain release factor 3, partial [Bdellovibrionota bacterium]
AADAAVMLIDAAKGVEPQTRKLFEVCRMRGIPIFTFMNKMDRPGREPFDLLDEIEKVLGIQSCPLAWPLGGGDRFRGIYDRRTKEMLLFQTEGEANVKGRLAPRKVTGLNDPSLLNIASGPRGDREEGQMLLEKMRGEIELMETAGNPFDLERVLRGDLTPVFFGSAMNNFGVQRFLDNFLELAPTPCARKVTLGSRSGQKAVTVDAEAEAPVLVEPSDERFSGFVFKTQANMDPAHRDRGAFLRICSGKFVRNMEVKHARLGTNVKIARPLQLFGQERIVVEEAWPGDIIGILDTSGDLRIGDTLCAASPPFAYDRVPSFSPEYFAGVLLKDPMRRKHLQKGLDQLAEEGVIQIYRQRGMGDKDPVLGAVGALQFEVLQFRLKAEYGVDVRIERLGFAHARWVRPTPGGRAFDPDFFERREDSRCLEDRDGKPVVLFKSEWSMRWARENYKDVEFVASGT